MVFCSSFSSVKCDNLNFEMIYVDSNAPLPDVDFGHFGVNGRDAPSWQQQELGALDNERALVQILVVQAVWDRHL